MQNPPNPRRRVKEWRRAWKVKLIEDGNPEWADLYSGIVG